MAKGNSLFGGKVYICETAQATDLDQAGFEGLTWVHITNATSKSEFGNTDEVLSEARLSGAPLRAKAVKSPGDVTLTLANDPTDAGQTALATAGKTSSFYAFKFEMADAPDATKTNTIYYTRGLVGEMMNAAGGPSNMDIKNVVLALQQYWLEVASTDVV